MRQAVNLTSRIETHLPAALADFTRQAGAIVAVQGQHLYLVGGAVRDLLLERATFDVDLVVDVDAISLAKQLVAGTQSRITTHSRFNTAKIRFDGWSVDIATVRSETYESPGALPKVGRGTLTSDLFRRDFTINAMAVDLTTSRYGHLIDLYGGLSDLQSRHIRVLHEESFADDATRIWRAIRYEQRLGFRLDLQTKRLLIRDIPMLATVTGDRIRHELELVLKEERPEKVLRRAGELGVLGRLHPSLKGDNWLAARFRQARGLSGNVAAPIGLCYALLGYRLTQNEAEQLFGCLNLSRQIKRDVTDTIGLRSKLDQLSKLELPPSGVHNLLKDYPETAIKANQLAAESPLVRRRLKLYLERLRYVKSVLTGGDLLDIGIQAGPRIKVILQALLEARLDGKVKSREGEARMVEERHREGSLPFRT